MASPSVPERESRTVSGDPGLKSQDRDLGAGGRLCTGACEHAEPARLPLRKRQSPRLRGTPGDGGECRRENELGENPRKPETEAELPA